jgi:hypothetical protein
MDSFIKFLSALKSTPWWLSLAIAIVALLTFFIPSLAVVAASWLPAVIVIAILFGLIFVFQMIDLGVKSIVKHPRRTKRFHITPEEGITKCYWTCTEQADKSWVMQLVARCVVKNLMDEPLILLKAKCVRPKLPGEVVQTIMPHNMFDPRSTAEMFFAITIRMTAGFPRGNINAVIKLIDDAGHENSTKFLYRDAQSVTKQL